MENVLFHAPAQPLDSDERYTPRWVFDGLDVRFGTDPCSPLEGGDCVPADVKYTIANDGLTQPWHGVVWVNPPFSNAAPFASRFIEHGNGIWLGPVSSTNWFQSMLGASDLVWLTKDFEFVFRGDRKRTAFALAFCAIGDLSSAALDRLARSGVHSGTLMQRVA